MVRCLCWWVRCWRPQGMPEKLPDGANAYPAYDN
ncbi:hypothetical protein CKO_00164 [Citrobacter koseri ATCC BAA-895]|uniref:Uncharacterized protein n=1 Tax=Citrobacter koseri (strain ATCC BAA-895 / CDC 4225-83 / SGSC4696) TaxID=290338 RepID=A8ACX0_CITK8|nr:hypothetical protein CKO_00164 [Citrobacter koseri ATCC BAA-895]